MDKDSDTSSNHEKLSKVNSDECCGIQVLSLSASSHTIGENKPLNIQKSRSDHAVGMAAQKQNSVPVSRPPVMFPASHWPQCSLKQPRDDISTPQNSKVLINGSYILLNGHLRYQGCYELTRKYSGNSLISRELKNFPRKSNSTEGLLESSRIDDDDPSI